MGHFLKCFLTCGVLLCVWSSKVSGQEYVDSLLTDKENFEEALKEVAPMLDFKGLPDGTAQDMGYMFLQKLVPSVFDVHQWVEVSGMSFEVDNMYNNGYNLLGSEGFLGRYALQTSVNVKHVAPFDVSLILANYAIKEGDTTVSQWRPFFNVSLDFQELRRQMLDKRSLTQLNGLMQQQTTQSPQMWSAWQYQTLAKVINNHKFATMSDSLSAINDSLTEHLSLEWDSATVAYQERICYTVEQANRLQEYYGGLKRTYNDWQPYWVKGQTALDSMKQVVQSQVSSRLDDTKQSLTQSLLAGTKRFKVGLAGTDMGRASASQRNAPLNGVQWLYEAKHFKFDVAAGAQLFRRNELIGFRQLFNEDRRSSGMVAGHLTLLYGQNSELMVGYAQYSQPRPFRFLPSFAADNTVFQLGIKQQLGKDFQLDGIIANARLSPDYQPIDAGLEEGEWLKYKLSADFQAKYQAHKNLQASAKMVYAGPLFYSLGNPYLINNRVVASGKLKAKMFKNRLNVEAEYRFTTPATTLATQVPLKGRQLFGSAMWQFKKAGSHMMVQYAPVVMLGQGRLDGQAVEQYVWLAQVNLHKKKKLHEIWSLSNVTNARTQLTFEDTTLVDGLLYVTQNFTWQYHSKHSLSLIGSLGMGGFEENLPMRNMLAQLKYQLEAKPFSPNVALEARHLHDNTDVLLGVAGGFEGKWKEHMEAHVQLLAAKPLAPDHTLGKMVLWGRVRLVVFLKREKR